MDPAPVEPLVVLNEMLCKEVCKLAGETRTLLVARRRIFLWPENIPHGLFVLEDFLSLDKLTSNRGLKTKVQAGETNTD